jgi:hypothetical protein
MDARRVSDDLLDKVMTGALPLHEVPMTLQQWFHLGWLSGRAGCEPQLRDKDRELDRLWRAAFSPIQLRPQGLTYAERLRAWGNHAEADRVERELNEMKFELNS